MLVDVLAHLPNPLAPAVVSDRELHQWPAELPDVASIHPEARRCLLEAVAAAGRGHPQLLLLGGEAGEGKTHLLAWLRRTLQGRAMFCHLPPLLDPGAPFRHGLRHVLAALCRPDRPEDPLLGTPLARHIWSILYAQARDLIDASQLGWYAGPPELPELLHMVCGEQTIPDGFASFAQAAAPLWDRIEAGLNAYLQDLPHEEPFDLALRSVLVQYPRSDKQALCTAWLLGHQLGGDDLARLGVAGRAGTEAEARRLLLALCRTSPATLVLGYDPTELGPDLAHDPRLPALVDLVAAVRLDGGATVQVVACLPPAQDALAAALQARPGVHCAQVRLTPLQPEQVRALILARLAAGFDRADTPPRPDPAYPFTEPELLAQAEGLCTPRAALLHFAAALDQRRATGVRPAPTAEGGFSSSADEKALTAVWQDALERARRAMEDTPPGGRAGSLRTVLRELFDGLRQPGMAPPGLEVQGCDPILGGGLRVSVQLAPGRVVRAALEVSNADAGPALIGAAGRLARQINDGRADVALLVREEGLPLAGAMAKAVAVQLGARGGLVWMSASETAELLAVERLLQAASGGELVVGQRTLGRPEVLAHVLSAGPPSVVRRLLERIQQADREPGAEAPSAWPASSAREPGATTPQAADLTHPAPLVVQPPRSAPARPTVMGMPLVSPQPVPAGLTAQQVFGALGERGELDEAALAKALGVPAGSMSSLLQPLEHQGMVRVEVRNGVRFVVRRG
ncbi:MAG: hypothetical protein NZ890_14180 [Myxococcota bacterium]|nr:hypothetical protein [Myxococcota bacterium]